MQIIFTYLSLPWKMSSRSLESTYFPPSLPPLETIIVLVLVIACKSFEFKTFPNRLVFLIGDIELLDDEALGDEGPLR